MPVERGGEPPVVVVRRLPLRNIVMQTFEANQAQDAERVMARSARTSSTSATAWFSGAISPMAKYWTT